MLKEKLVDFVHPLLMQLAEAKSRATTCDHGDPILTTELFEKMEGAARFMEDVSLRLERWEREAQDSVGGITKLLNDMFEDDGNLNRGEGFQLKLQTVDRKVADLKAHMTPPLVLPHPHVEEESSSSTLPPHLMTLSLPDVAPDFDVGQRYENLNDPALQKCLLSLCFFPKDAVIKKRLLIYLWIGEGLANGELSAPNEFEALRSLTISWEAKLSSSSSSSHQGGLRYLDHVCIPSNLDKLDLRCFPGSKAPKCLNPDRLWNLKRLYVRGGSLCGFGWIPPSPKIVLWPGLILRLRFLSELHMEECELLELFPTLVFLEIHECKKMRSTARRFNGWSNFFGP